MSKPEVLGMCFTDVNCLVECTVNKGPLFPYAICDGCFQQIYVVLYKCQECKDYCLCSDCEGRGIHDKHKMIARQAPLPHSAQAGEATYTVL